MGGRHPEERVEVLGDDAVQHAALDIARQIGAA